jgi:hypothetical protein
MDISTGANAPADAPTYEPPTLVVLGFVAELTLGSSGSFMDSTGRGSKKPKK